MGFVYNQKLLDHTKQSAQMHLKLLKKKTIQKTAAATDDLTGNKITNKITKAWKNHCIILQRQVKVKQKYLEKDTYLKKKT